MQSANRIIIVPFQGKGDMRTFWLLSEDDERIQRRFGSNGEMQRDSLRKTLSELRPFIR